MCICVQIVNVHANVCKVMVLTEAQSQNQHNRSLSFPNKVLNTFALSSKVNCQGTICSVASHHQFGLPSLHTNCRFVIYICGKLSETGVL